MVMWTMSDRAIPRSFRFMEGFGVHTFRLVAADGTSSFVKFHWKPKLGLQSVVWNEAVKINGADPDFHRRDLWDAINSGDFPEWELGLQVFDDEFADSFDFDVLDATKIIPEELVPVRRVGRLVLDQTVDNFFAETEQVAFCTQNVVPGIDFTNDPLLQGRNFSYLDTQLKRLGGPNFTHLPVNAPKCPVAHFQQDGHMAFTNPVGRVNYEPNSWSDPGPREDPSGGFTSFAEPVEGTKQRVRSERFGDHYSQARQFLISQTPIERAHIVAAFVFELSKCEQPGIRARMVANLRNVDEAFAAEMAAGLRLDPLPPASVPARAPITGLPPSPALSIVENGPANFAGRKVGVLITDGTDRAALDALRKAADRGRRAGRADRSRDRRRHAQRRATPAGAPAHRRRAVGALRRRGHPRLRRGSGRARRQPSRPRLRARCPRPRQVHRLLRVVARPARRGRRRRIDRRGLRAARHEGLLHDLRRALSSRALLAPSAAGVGRRPARPAGARRRTAAAGRTAKLGAESSTGSSGEALLVGCNRCSRSSGDRASVS